MNDTDILNAAQEMIREEGRVVQEIASQLDSEFVRASRIIAAAPGVILTTGAGTSGTIARRMAHLFSTTGMHSFFQDSATALHGPSAMITPDDVLIAISKGGESQEINLFAALVRKRGAKVISLTWEPASELAKLSDVALIIRPDERGEGDGILPFGSTLANGAVGDALCLISKRLRGFDLQTMVETHPSGDTASRILKMDAH